VQCSGRVFLWLATRPAAKVTRLIASRLSGEIYFNCTEAGASRTGQVWRYRPSKREGRRQQGDYTACATDKDGEIKSAYKITA